MEDPKGNIGLLESVQEKTIIGECPNGQAPGQPSEYEHRVRFLSGEAVSFRRAMIRFRNALSFAKYRLPRPVKEYILYRDTIGTDYAYFLCPQCGITLDREFQAFCDRCGQQLDWKEIHKATRRTRTP